MLDNVTPPVENFQVATTLSASLRDELEALASRNDRSLAAEIRIAIKERLERQNGKAAA
jgi:predicted transcriptional regulator